MCTHNIGFYEEISKIITYHQISSNRQLISSADQALLCGSLSQDTVHVDSEIFV